MQAGYSDTPRITTLLTTAALGGAAWRVTAPVSWGVSLALCRTAAWTGGHPANRYAPDQTQKVEKLLHSRRPPVYAGVPDGILCVCARTHPALNLHAATGG